MPSNSMKSQNVVSAEQSGRLTRAMFGMFESMAGQTRDAAHADEAAAARAAEERRAAERSRRRVQG